ncbi:MAG: hydroxyacylglutathione hydrolase [Pseudomonadota bacterium]
MHHQGSLTVHQFPCLNDNYGFLVRDKASGTTAAIDTPDGEDIIKQAEALSWTIDLILNTHWHPDHIGGNDRIAEHFGAKVYAPEAEGDKIAHKSRALKDGDTVMLGETALQVIGVPGHTLGHIAYYAPSAEAAFVGDTLFSLGCGRLFEGTPEEMWTSLLKLRALPAETTIFCAHEYTAANAAFALSVDDKNKALQARADEVTRLRAEGKPTVPVILSNEIATNPFLRADDPMLAASVGREGAPHHEVFAEIRARKDQF